MNFLIKHKYLLLSFLLVHLTMTKIQSVSDQGIIDCLNTKYGINVATLTHIPLGADVDASVYKAQTHDNLSYFVKVKRGSHYDIAATIQQLLYDAGISQIIAPVKTNYGQAVQAIDDCMLTVYPFIEGKDGFSCNLNDDQWITLGKALRQVHEFRLPPIIKNQINKESYSPQWREAVRSIYSHIDVGFKIADVTALKLLTFMKEHRDTIQRLADRAEQLSQNIQKKSLEFVLCHSDIHAGNVLIANNGTLYIVDWDQPIMAPKERDLMFIGGGVANVWNKPHEQELFYKGYGETVIDQDILTYYRCERIVEDIAIYSQQLLLSADGGNNREIMYTHFMNMFEPNGVVDIAFASDKNS